MLPLLLCFFQARRKTPDLWWLANVPERNQLEKIDGLWGSGNVGAGENTAVVSKLPQVGIIQVLDAHSGGLPLSGRRHSERHKS